MDHFGHAHSVATCKLTPCPLCQERFAVCPPLFPAVAGVASIPHPRECEHRGTLAAKYCKFTRVGQAPPLGADLTRLSNYSKCLLGALTNSKASLPEFQAKCAYRFAQAHNIRPVLQVQHTGP